MVVSAWYGGYKTSPTFGIQVGAINRETYFNHAWCEIVVEIDAKPYFFKLTPGFWRKCPEFRDCGQPVIKNWLQRNKTLQWPKGCPPQAKLLPLGENKFRLLP